MTGMIFPRRLMTPTIRSGALGTEVISGTRTISRTAAIRAVGFAATRPLYAGTVENEFVHAIEQVAREFEHLLGGGGKFSEAGSGLLHQFAHFIHGANDGLGAGSLFFDGRIDFLGNFGKAAGGFGNLRGTDGLFVGSRADFLRELVDFGNYIGNLVQSGA